MESPRIESKTKNSCDSPRKVKFEDRRSISQESLNNKRNRKSMRRKKSLDWDVPPKGFENISPEAYKEMLKQGQGFDGVLTSSRQVLVPILSASVTRQARRLYIGNIPFAITEEEMIAFFNYQMHLLGICQSDGNPVVACQINWEKNFAFLELRSIDETTQATALNGIYFKNQILKVRRPLDYLPLPSCKDSRFIKNKDPAIPGFISSLVPDSPNKIFIGGIPKTMGDEKLKEFLQTFGKLRGLNRIRDSISGISKGYAFCEYIDPSLTNTVVASMNGIAIGDKKLTVQLAILGKKMTSDDSTMNENSDFIQNDATEVLCLLNMVTLDDLIDDDEYSDIICDIREECQNYGIVRSIEAPRPIENIMVQGCGKVYVEFNTVYDCQRAQNALTGRKFNGRIVVTSYYDPEKFHNQDFR